MAKRKPWTLGGTGLLIAAVLISAMALGGPAEASAASISEIQNQIDDLESRQSEIAGQVAQLESQLKDNLSEMEETIQQKLLVDQQIFLMFEQVNNINERISAYNVLIADKQDELDSAQKHHDELKEAYKARIRAMEEDGTVSYWAVLFKSESFSDFLDRMNMIEEIAASDHRRLQELQDAADAVEAAQTALETEKAAAEDTRAELEAAQAALYEKQEQADVLLAELRAKGDEYMLHLEEAELQQSILMNELAQKNVELEDAKYQQWLSTYVPPTTTAPAPTTGDQNGENNDQSGEGSADSGTAGEETGGSEESGGSEDSGSSNESADEGWKTPVYGYYISSPFGPRTNPFSGNEQWHEGIDMVCAGGNPIYATRSGVVTSASYNDSCGYYVYISHDGGYGSIYMHMTHYVVGYGDYVSQGDIIGYVGSTGESEVEHLHFGISYNGSYVNPLNYI